MAESPSEPLQNGSSNKMISLFEKFFKVSTFFITFDFNKTFAEFYSPIFNVFYKTKIEKKLTFYSDSQLLGFIKLKFCEFCFKFAKNVNESSILS